MGYRTLLEKVLAEERIGQITLRRTMSEKLSEINNGGSDDIAVINKGNISRIVSGKQYRIKEITARRILLTINSLRRDTRKKYKFFDVFEPERLMFCVKEHD